MREELALVHVERVVMLAGDRRRRRSGLVTALTVNVEGRAASVSSGR